MPGELSESELIALDVVNRALPYNYFDRPESLKRMLLNPEVSGEFSGHSGNSFIGLTYQPMRQDKNSTNVEGVIVDSKGIGYVTGALVNMNGYRELHLKRHDITQFGVSKDTSLNYICTEKEGEHDLIGNLGEDLSSRVALHERKSSPEVKQAIQTYYDNFVSTMSRK